MAIEHHFAVPGRLWSTRNRLHAVFAQARRRPGSSCVTADHAMAVRTASRCSGLVRGSLSPPLREIDLCALERPGIGDRISFVRFAPDPVGGDSDDLQIVVE